MKHLISILAILFSTLLSAQEECITLLPNDEERMIEMEQFIARGADQSKSANSCRTYKVRVIVIYSEFLGNINSNITDEQAESSIRGLNAAFANEGHKYDSEGIELPYRFYLDSVIRFNGVTVFSEQWNNGIRTGSGTFGVHVNTVRAYVNTISPFDEYINIITYRTVADQGTVSGFAYIASPHLGIYVRASNLGDSFYQDEYNQQFAGYPNNTTLVHEFGHALGLLHTFQATNSCLTETNCMMHGDRICSTLPETQAFGCYDVCGHNSRNYMSYKSCKDKFDYGQAERMAGVVAFPINGFSNYEYCPPCPESTADFNNDGLVNILDISLLSYSFGCVEGDDCYNPIFDLNCDGVINMLDISTMQGKFGNTITTTIVDSRDIENIKNMEVYNMLGQRVRGELKSGMYITIINGVAKKIVVSR